MKVTLKTAATWPRHTGKLFPAGSTIDVPNDVANDWIKRDLAEEANSFVPAQPQPKVK